MRSVSLKWHISQKSIQQNFAESGSNRDNETAQNDKTITTPEQEKETLLHEKCATGVHQNFLRLPPELEFVIKAWSDLSEDVKRMSQER